MIVVSKLNKPIKLKQVIHKDLRGSLTEIFLKKPPLSDFVPTGKDKP